MDFGSSSIAVLSTRSSLRDFMLPMFIGNSFNFEQSERIRISRFFSPEISVGNLIILEHSLKFK